MIKKQVFIIALLVSFSISLAKADSPLTSIYFINAYQDVPVVVKAGNTNGLLTEEFMGYLTDRNPVDYKIALINTLGWDINGKTNATRFMRYLGTKYASTDSINVINKLDADVLLCLAYINAMDNYFDMTQSLKLAQRAVAINSHSLTISMVAAMMNSQKALMDHDWCKVFRLADDVRKDQNLNTDMRPAAIALVFDYLSDYQEYCK